MHTGEGGDEEGDGGDERELHVVLACRQGWRWGHRRAGWRDGGELGGTEEGTTGDGINISRRRPRSKEPVSLRLCGHHAAVACPSRR